MFVCVCKRVRERDRETETERDRHRERIYTYACMGCKSINKIVLRSDVELHVLEGRKKRESEMNVTQVCGHLYKLSLWNHPSI